MKSRHLSILLLLTSIANGQIDRTFIKSKLAAERHLPFSSGVEIGDTLYIAGTTIDPAKAAIGISPANEAREVMDQVKQTVEKAGMTMRDVVSIQVFCTDLTLYDTFNGVYEGYFHPDFPARAFVGVSKLLFGARFEVMGVAVRRKDLRVRHSQRSPAAR